VQVRLLGPVDVLVEGASRPVQGLRRKAVLAVLALQRGEIISTDRLVDAVWGDTAPLTAVNTVQSHVSHLRHVLGTKAAIRARPPGYLLDLGADATDVQVAERLVRQGTQAPEPADRARLLQTALALWRGRPLADVAGLPWLDEQAARLDQFWLHAQRALVEARLALGEHVQLVPDLERLVQDHAFDEQIHGQLMLALYRAGRQADALAAYQRLRRSLGDDLGIDPSQPLRELEAAILRQEPALDLPASADAGTATAPGVLLGPPAAEPPDSPPPPGSAPAPVPMQLPLALRAFAGRSEELAKLDAMLPPETAAGPQPSATVVISAVSGTAGVGKTTLAVHWAHRVAHRFPDGQLYVNLRGFDPSGSALDPAEAVRGFLGALRVPMERIPASLDAQTALYRSLLAGKRMLVLLDNARDADQVRPLLPGSAGCLVLVTSRNQLTSLVAGEGASPLTLDLLTSAEARQLLVRRLGSARISAEPFAVSEVIARCAGLPLALAIVAARAASRPEFSLTMLARGLRQAGDLDAFDGGDAAADVRSVLSWSYQTLSAEAARLFRLLGLHPGPDVAVAAAASMADVPLAKTRRVLSELTRAHLLTEPVAGRFAWHDLLRAYAAELGRQVDSDLARRAVVHRMLDHYLHTADAAAALRFPHRDPIGIRPPLPGVVVEELADRADALAWFTAEQAVLLATVELAAAAGFDIHTWQLSRSLANFLDGQGQWHDLAASQEAALAATVRLADRPAQARIHRLLARVAVRLGSRADAQAHLQQALDLYQELGDPLGQGHAEYGLTRLWEGEGRHAEALRHAQRALELYRAAEHRVGQAQALNAVGWCHAQLGDYQKALSYCTQALALQQEVGDRSSQADTHDSIGYAHHHLGDHAAAIDCYQRALALHHQLGDRYREAEALTHLGDAHDAAGDAEAAREVWRSALAILEDLDHPSTADLRARLQPRHARLQH
jgi:DNA-binding SARP family transcriptional activator/Tfp pilus assembly protein PilF